MGPGRARAQFEVVVEAIADLPVEAVDARLGGIDDRCLARQEVRNLQVLIVVVECRQLDRERAVVVLVADLERVDRFRPHRVADEARARRVFGGGQVDRVLARAADIENRRLVAARVGRIDTRPIGRLEPDYRAGREGVAGDRRDIGPAHAVAAREEAVVVIGVIHHVVSIAQARGDEPLRRQLIGEVGECRVALGPGARSALPGAVVDEAVQRQVIHVSDVGIAVLEVEQARGPLQLAARLGRQQEFLADRFVEVRQAELEDVVAAVVQLLRGIDRLLAPLGVGGQVGEAEVGLDRALDDVAARAVEFGIGARGDAVRVEGDLSRSWEERQRSARNDGVEAFRVRVEVGRGEQRPRIVVLGMLVVDQDRDIIAEVRLEAESDRPVLIVADPAQAVADVALPAVAAAVEALDIHRDGLADAVGRIGLGTELIEAAVGQLDLAARFRAWLGRLDQDRAAGRVAAEQGALRALQNLDGLHVQQLGVGRQRVGRIEAVDVDADVAAAARGGHGGADAADRRLEEGAGIVEAQAGGDLRDVRQLADIGGGQGFLAEGRDRDRHVDRAFRAPLGGDDDFAAAVIVVCRRLLGECARGHGQGRRGDAD